MRFLIDENVHVKVEDFLSGRGHDVLRVPRGGRNGEVIGLALAEGRVLLTQDKDFLDQSRYPPRKYLGIVCLRVHPPVLESIIKAVDLLLKTVAEDQFSGVSFSLSDDGIEKLPSQSG